MIKHLFINPKSDGADATVTRPSDWNADHIVDNSLVLPQGRLTLQSGASVQTADQIAKSTVYYHSHIGSLVPIWNGTYWTLLSITSDEISVGLDATVPRIASGSVYDIFGINNSGVLATVCGPAWTSTTSRGTGGTTTELQRLNGIYTNKNAITAYGGVAGTTSFSPSAGQATYLGSLYATANGQTGIPLKPNAAAGGTNNIVGLFNAYNTVPASAVSRDSTASWNYNLTTWRSLNNSNSNRISYLDGLGIISPKVAFTIFVTSGASTFAACGVNFDSTTAAPGVTVQNPGGAASVQGSMTSVENFYPALGFHYLQAMEVSAAGNPGLLGGAASPTRQLNALVVDLII